LKANHNAKYAATQFADVVIKDTIKKIEGKSQLAKTNFTMVSCCYQRYYKKIEGKSQR
jgi:hypothetical protein